MKLLPARLRRTKPHPLDQALFYWSRGDPFTFRDALAGTCVFGATGAGKSSGSGQAIATSMLSAGFGGLVLTAKADERQVWESYCRASGRLDDLVVIGPNSGHCFNFLDHEVSRRGSGAGLVENIVALLMTALEAAERDGATGSGREEEGYWRRALHQLIRNIVALLLLAGVRIDAPSLYKAAISAPTSMAQIRDKSWQEQSSLFGWLREADERAQSEDERADLQLLIDYWTVEFPSLAAKTRSIVLSSFTSTVDVLNRGVLRRLFSGDSTITPEAVEHGKIVLLDLPVKEFGEVGLMFQMIWKYAFQKSIERRDLGVNDRPVFLSMDEAQHFLSAYDMQFQTTCRAARVATVMLSQNYSNFVAALGGGELGRVQADSLLANLNTKIAHANGDPVTNEWLAGLIGRALTFTTNGSTTRQRDNDLPPLLAMSGLFEDSSETVGYSESYEYEVQPQAFTRLRTGGPLHDYIVDGIVFRTGRPFRKSGRMWQCVHFKQRS